MIWNECIWIVVDSRSYNNTGNERADGTLQCWGVGNGCVIKKKARYCNLRNICTQTLERYKTIIMY